MNDNIMGRIRLSIGGRLLVPVLVALLLAFGGPLAAQTPDVAARDTAAAAPAPVIEPPYSPRGAFFRSLILPGWGQSYVGAPGRGAVYFALAGGSGWMAWVARQQRAAALDQQAWLRETGAIASDYRTTLVRSRSQQFEDWTALTVFFIFFAGADAYVSAYLSDFDERIGVTSGQDGALQIRATLPVSWPR
jgi:hypothetical protein